MEKVSFGFRDGFTAVEDGWRYTFLEGYWSFWDVGMLCFDILVCAGSGDVGVIPVCGKE